MSTTSNTSNTSADVLTMNHTGDGFWYLADSAGNGTCENSPRVLECEGDWKVSPFGDAAPDRGCYWVDSFEEARLELVSLLAS